MDKRKKNTKGTSSSGTKKRKEKAPTWDPKARALVDHEEEQRPSIFKATHDGAQFLIERPVDREKFAPFGVVSKFEDLGWSGVLDFDPKVIHKDAVVEWMSTLSMIGDDEDGEGMKLRGMVGKKECILSVEKIRRLFKVDTGLKASQGLEIEDHYECWTEDKRRGIGLSEEQQQAIQNCIFFTQREGAKFAGQDKRIEMRPLAKAIISIVRANVNPRVGDRAAVRYRDTSIVYALMTGTPAISYAFNTMLNIWKAYNTKGSKTYPHTGLISMFLAEERAVRSHGEAHHPRAIRPDQATYTDIEFKETAEGFVIQDVGNSKTRGHMYLMPRSDSEQVQQPLMPQVRLESPLHQSLPQDASGDTYNVADMMATLLEIKLQLSESYKVVQQIKGDMEAETKLQMEHRKRYEFDQALMGARLARIEEQLRADAQARADHDRNRRQDDEVIVDQLKQMQEQLDYMQDIGLDTYHTTASTRFHQEYYQHGAWYSSTHNDPMDIDGPRQMPVPVPVVYRHPDVRDYPGPSAYQHYRPPTDEFHQDGFEKSNRSIFGYSGPFPPAPHDNH